MNAKDMLQIQMDLGLFVLKTYVSDLSDADLLLRPAPGCNQLAWQLGHLIHSEAQLLESVCPGASAPLPPGFAEQHAREVAQNDGSQFLSRQEYVDLYDQQRAATKAALAKLSEADLDKPSPEHLRKRFPTVGALMNLIGAHPLMHAGQFVAVRRTLGKPVLI